MDREYITIKIQKASEDDGYFYDIYLDKDVVDDDTEADDGGHCTSEDVRDAIEMASEQAQRLLVNLDNKHHG